MGLEHQAGDLMRPRSTALVSEIHHQVTASAAAGLQRTPRAVMSRLHCAAVAEAVVIDAGYLKKVLRVTHPSGPCMSSQS